MKGSEHRHDMAPERRVLSEQENYKRKFRCGGQPRMHLDVVISSAFKREVCWRQPGTVQAVPLKRGSPEI